MPTMVEDLKDLLRTLLARNRVGLLAAMPPRTLPRAPRAGPRSLEAEAEALLDDLSELSLPEGVEAFQRLAEVFAQTDRKAIELCLTRWRDEYPTLVIAEVMARVEQSANSQELDLSGLGLTDFPHALVSRGPLLRHVRVLYLGQNRLTQVPEVLARLPCRIHTLDLSNNLLAALPDDDIAVLQQIESLVHLRLANCRIRSVGRSIGELRLRSLSLANNGLDEIPESLCDMTTLESLDLSSNTLITIPEELIQLSHLHTLGLANCGIAGVPQLIGSLSRLERLDLSRNQFKALPISIGRLARLRALNLQDNRLEVLPDTMEALTALQELKLAQNPGLRIPPEVLGDPREPPTPRSILFYYFNLRRSRPLNEGKLILVGHGGVGKTSLVNRLVHGRFNLYEEKTAGVVVEPWDIVVRSPEGAVRLRLHVWDFGGQEIMHATHQFFLTERALYVIVIGCRVGQGDWEVEYWLRLVSSFGGSSPIIIVLNRIHEHNTDLNYTSLRSKYPQIVCFLKTDCSDSFGLPELRAKIVEVAPTLPDIGVMFPANWFVVKNRLSGMREPYLSLAQYRAICDELGVSDRQAQDGLAGYLHRLGIILHYRDDIRLRDTSVLSPRWVTSGVYEILNRRELAEQNGEFVEANLADWLPEAQYPVEKHAFLIDLMRRFSMCIEYDASSERYLIPDLLPKNTPMAVLDMFRPDSCINLEFRYELLPEGLIPRFIARTHLRSEGQPRWRSGVVLTLQGCHALVMADTIDCKVLVRVRGPASRRRTELFTIIREEFERIHAQIPHLPVRAFIPMPEYPGHSIEFDKLRLFAEDGATTIREMIKGRLVDLPVRLLLEGVDTTSLPGESVGRDAQLETSVPLVYCHYVQPEADHAHTFSTHMRLYERARALRVFRDLDQPHMVSERALRDASVVVVLVSAAVFAAANGERLERILEHCTRSGIPVLPVLVRSCAVEATPFRDTALLPRGNQAVDLSANEDLTWTGIAQEIRKLVVAGPGA